MDETAFEIFCRQHWQPLLAYALRRGQNPDDAADAVQEVFSVAWRRRVDVPAPPQDRLWLFGVARLVLANQRRGVRRWSDLQSRLASVAEHAAPDPSRLTEQRASHAVLLSVLARLSDADRELLTLIAWDGLTPSDAATAIGLAPVTARVRLHRARQRLRRLLDAEDTNLTGPDGHVRLDRQPTVPARGTS